MDIDGSKCRPEKDGWVAHYKSGMCECGLGFCLMPIAKGLFSPSKYHCMKLNPQLTRNAATGICECSKEEAGVASSDPAVATPPRVASCKVVPSTPVANNFDNTPLYAEFSCMRKGYVKSTTSDACATCSEESCRMPRPGVSFADRNPKIGLEASQFYCVAPDTMDVLQMTRKSDDGSCQCKADECLAPFRDTLRCVPLKGSHPYGGVKLSDGKCGCAKDEDACILPTKPAGFGTSSAGFVCLRLRDGSRATAHGKTYYRGKTGYCRCLPTHCRADAAPETLGDYRCIDIEKEGAYKLDEDFKKLVESGNTNATMEDLPCTCAPGACMLPGDGRDKQVCVPCPTQAGQCVSRCSKDSQDIISCMKYCATEIVKTKPAFGMSYVDMFSKEKFDARVIRCFVAKTITCQTDVTNKKECTQVTTARAQFDCPGIYSLRSNRVVMDGTLTHGFKSACDLNNFACQKEKCNVVANPAVCLKGMLLA